jgi:hydrogenase/urease accessory protein HupE
MSGTANTRPAPTRWTRGAAILALIFGVMTIVSGGSVLFGGEAVRAQAGNVVQIVVWFNFMAGFAYVLAALAFGRRKLGRLRSQLQSRLQRLRLRPSLHGWLWLVPPSRCGP